MLEVQLANARQLTLETEEGEDVSFELDEHWLTVRKGDKAVVIVPREHVVHVRVTDDVEAR